MHHVISHMMYHLMYRIISSYYIITYHIVLNVNLHIHSVIQLLELQVGDFGIARVLESTTAVAVTMLGTPYYMSPEAADLETYFLHSSFCQAATVGGVFCVCILIANCHESRSFSWSFPNAWLPWTFWLWVVAAENMPLQWSWGNPPRFDMSSVRLAMVVLLWRTVIDLRVSLKVSSKRFWKLTFSAIDVFHSISF